MKAIVAVNENWAIGNKGQLLYHIKEDLQNFKKVTLNHPVIYGRKTLETFPGGKPLLDRENFILSSNKDYNVPNAIIVHSIEDCFNKLEDRCEDAFCLGGESVYNQFFPYLEEIHVTMIKDSCEADCYFHNLDKDNEWKLDYQSEEYCSRNLKYEFRIYRKG